MAAMKINKSVPRVIGENRGAYIGMFYMVLLSGFLLVFFVLAASNLGANKDAYFRDYVQCDLEFYAASRIVDIDGIEKMFGLKIEESVVKEFPAGGATLRLFTPNEKVNIAAITEGRLPSTGEVALDPQFAKANGYYIGGDKIDGRAENISESNGAGGSVIDIGGKPYTVSGYVCLPNYAYVLQKEGDIVNNPNLFGIGLLNRDDLPDGNLLYSVKFDEPQPNIYEQAKPLKAYLNELGINILALDYAKYNMKTNMPNVEALAITVYSFVLPPILMLLSAALVAVVLGRMVKNQAGVIGTLYALGYRKNEIMRHYMRYPLLLGVAGGVAGGALGTAGFVPMLGVMLTFFPMPIARISFNPLFAALSAVLPAIILCAGTYAALNGILKQPPVSLMRGDYAAGKPGAGAVKPHTGTATPGAGTAKSRTGAATPGHGAVKPHIGAATPGPGSAPLSMLERKLLSGNISFSLRFKIREQLRSVPRLAFMIVGVFAATALLMFGLIAKNTLDNLINQGGGGTLHYNYEYALKVPQSVPPPEGGEAIAGRKFVPEFDPGNRFEIIGVSPGSRAVTLFDIKGDPLPVDGDKTIISKSMAKKYKLSVGDEIRFSDIINDSEHAVKITHVAETNMGDYIFTPLSKFDEILGWEQGAYNAIMSDAPLAIDEKLLYKISEPDNLAEALAEYMLLMNSVIYGIALVAAIIGMIVLYVITGISIDENRGGISLMKVFGYKKAEVGALIVNSSRVVVAFGFTISVPVTFALIGRLLTYVFDLVNITVEPRLNWYFIALGFALIFGAFEASKALSVRKIGKTPLSEALKAQRE